MEHVGRETSGREMVGWDVVSKWVKRNKDNGKRLAQIEIAGCDVIPPLCGAISDESGGGVPGCNGLVGPGVLRAKGL